MRRIWIVALAALAAAGCGGASEPPRAPELPRPLALGLAAQTEAVAQAVRSGDSCGADARANALLARVDAAIAGGRVPAALRMPLRRGASALAARTTCVQPPPPPVVQQNDDRGKGKHKGKGKGKGKDSGSG